MKFEDVAHQVRIGWPREDAPGWFNWVAHRINPPALTMCGDKSIRLLHEALQEIQRDQIPGDLIEAGVWRGGIPILMRAFLKEVGDSRRCVWVADSFAGLPQPKRDWRDRLAHKLLNPARHLTIPRAQVEQNFAHFGLLDDQVQFAEGWFSETLAKIPAERFALIRLDGDYYESTRDALNALYPKLSPGGFLIVDDYHLPLGCKAAVDEYRKRHQITAPLIRINKQSVFWRNYN